MLLSLLACPGAGQFLLGRRRLGLLFAAPAVALGCGLLALFTFDLARAVLDAALDDSPSLFSLLARVLRGRALAYGGGLLGLALLGLASAAEVLLVDRRERP